MEERREGVGKRERHKSPQTAWQGRTEGSRTYWGHDLYLSRSRDVMITCHFPHTISNHCRDIQPQKLVHRDRQTHTRVKTVYPPVSLSSLGGYNNSWQRFKPVEHFDLSVFQLFHDDR